MIDEPVASRLLSAGIRLPAAVKPVANYTSGMISPGPLLFLSGQGTRKDGVFQYVGKLGAELTVDQGYQAARLCAINMLAQIEAICGLDAVRRVVKLTGFVNAVPDFVDAPKVLDGASDMMVQAFAAEGRHARSAVGVATLPFGMAVEVEGVFEVDPNVLPRAAPVETDLDFPPKTRQLPDHQ